MHYFMFVTGYSIRFHKNENMGMKRTDLGLVSLEISRRIGRMSAWTCSLLAREDFLWSITSHLSSTPSIAHNITLKACYLLLFILAWSCSLLAMEDFLWSITSHFSSASSIAHKIPLKACYLLLFILAWSCSFLHRNGCYVELLSPLINIKLL